MELPTLDEIATVWTQYSRSVTTRNDPELIVHMRDFSVASNDEGKKLISNLSWSVKRGERWLVAGGNGAGKSTLSRLLANPEKAVTKEGTLLVTGEPNTIGWVSTELHMSMSRLSCTARDVLLGRDNDSKEGIPDDVGLKVAKWLNLQDDQLTRPFARLSQGEQKIVLICKAIAKTPHLLIIDEPLQGLDLVKRRIVLGLVERLCRATDVSLIYVTHHFEECIPSVSHVLHLKDGQSVFNDVFSAYDPGVFQLSTDHG